MHAPAAGRSVSTGLNPTDMSRALLPIRSENSRTSAVTAFRLRLLQLFTVVFYAVAIVGFVVSLEARARFDRASNSLRMLAFTLDTCCRCPHDDLIVADGGGLPI